MEIYMRRLILRERGQLEIVESSIPDTLENEVLLRVKYCAICETDVHAYDNGIHIPAGTVMGHEITGTIEKVGNAVTRFRRGDRVVVNPMPRCGHCEWCLRGEYSLCETAADFEIGFHVEHPGGFADYVLIKYPDVMLLPIPDSLSWEAAALAEPLATSLHAVRQARPVKGKTVVVAGAGMIGLGVARFLYCEGAKRIVVIEPSRIKSEVARLLGADAVLDPSDRMRPIQKEVAFHTGGSGADIVFECAGTAASFRSAADYAKRGGQVILAGFCEEEVAVSPLSWIMREIEVKAILGYYDEFSEVLASLARGDIPTERLITDTVSLTDAEARGFKRILIYRDTIRILVDMESGSHSD